MVGGAVRVGEIDVISLVDADGVLGEYAQLFPEVPERHWAPWRELYPELFDGGLWTMPFRAFLVRAPGQTILVDTGVGPAGEAEWMPERQGRLLGELERQGVTPHQVDVVFITHVHIDHIGWSAAFTSSQFVTHRDGIATAAERGPSLPEGIETVEGEAELAPGVVAFELPGHLPGHMGVRVGEELALLADTAVHPAQLVQAGWVYLSDDDPPRAAKTREELLAAYGDRILAGSHFPGTGFGRLADGVWTPLLP